MLLALMVVAPLGAALAGRFGPGRWSDLGQLVGATVTSLLCLGIIARVFTRGPIAEGVLYLDPLGALLVAVIALVGWGGAAYAVEYLRRDVATGHLPSGQPRWFYLWYHFFLASMLAVATTDNLGLVWVGIEATTVFSAILVGFYRSRAALEAAWKYLMICTVGISFALFGTLLLYYAGVHGVPDEAAALSWRALRENATRLDPRLVRLAFVFILAGYGTKAGFAPLHTWLPDAHSQAPTPVSAVLSGVLLPCALYAIVRVHLIAVGTLGPAFSSSLLVAFGLLSVGVAVPFILVQHDLKRLLAYSSMEHIGIMAIAFGFGGPLGFFGGALHLVVHGIVKALLFVTSGAITQRYQTRDMSRIHGVIGALPYSGPVLLVGTLLLAGAPPSGLFLTEFSVLLAGFTTGRAVLSILLLVGLTAVFVGMFFHVSRMALGTPRRAIVHGESHLIAWFAGVPLAAVILVGIALPPPLTLALGKVVTLLGGA